MGIFLLLLMHWWRSSHDACLAHPCKAGREQSSLYRAPQHGRRLLQLRKLWVFTLSQATNGAEVLAPAPRYRLGLFPRIAKVGRDVWRSSLLRAGSGWVLSISKDRKSTTCLGDQRLAETAVENSCWECDASFREKASLLANPRREDLEGNHVQPSAGQNLQLLPQELFLHVCHLAIPPFAQGNKYFSIARRT